jgi:hypothetical protein
LKEKTVTFIEPRTPREFAEVLAYYHGHRADHPLPAGWSADVSGLERAAGDSEREMDPDPFLVFWADRGWGRLQIMVDLYCPATAVVFVGLDAEERLAPTEYAELLFSLLGISTDPGQLESAAYDYWTEDLTFTYPPTTHRLNDGPDCPSGNLETRTAGRSSR